MNNIIANILHYLSQLSLAIIPIYFAYWLNKRK